MKPVFILSCILALSFPSAWCQQRKTAKGHESNPYYSATDTSHLRVKNAEWKKILPPGLYSVAREQATEKAFSGKYWKNNPKGTYYCAVCGNKLFKSDAKFASTCGWPSFLSPTGKTVLFTGMTIPTTCIAQKSFVQDVILTLGIFLMTALRHLIKDFA